MPACKDCDQEIEFAVTEKGHRLPLDPEHRTPEEGPWAFAVRRDPLRLRVRPVDGDRPLQPFERPAQAHASSCSKRRGARRG